MGNFTLVRRLGSGGFGSVWLGEDGTGGQVAVKVLHPKYCGPSKGRGPSIADRFLEEARLLMGLRHPGIVEVREVIDDRAHGVIAYVMERLRGRNLQQISDLIDLPSLLEVFASVADALAFLHERGVLHRDVKPANVVVCDPQPGTGAEGDRAVKLIDFGVAKELWARDVVESTATGMLIGTLETMAPECLRRLQGEDVELTVAVDLWSVGISLYTCLSGRPPFSANAPLAVIEAIETAPLPPLVLRQSFGLAEVPEALGRILYGLLEKRPEARLKSAAALAGALREVANRLDPSRRKRRPLAALARLPRSPSVIAEPAPITERPVLVLEVPPGGNAGDTSLDLQVAYPQAGSEPPQSGSVSDASAVVAALDAVLSLAAADAKSAQGSSGPPGRPAPRAPNRGPRVASEADTVMDDAAAQVISPPVDGMPVFDVAAAASRLGQAFAPLAISEPGLVVTRSPLAYGEVALGPPAQDPALSAPGLVLARAELEHGRGDGGYLKGQVGRGAPVAPLSRAAPPRQEPVAPPRPPAPRGASLLPPFPPAAGPAAALAPEPAQVAQAAQVAHPPAPAPAPAGSAPPAAPYAPPPRAATVSSRPRAVSIAAPMVRPPPATTLPRLLTMLALLALGFLLGWVARGFGG